MFQKFGGSLRIQFLIIALSLTVTSSILGLSAYLTDTDTYQGSFRTAAGEELGFRLSGDAYEDQTITPGSTVPLNVSASINESIDLFVFVEMDLSPEFLMNGFKTDFWHPIKEDSNIYYYGTSTKIVALGRENGSTAPILESITLNTEAQCDENYYVTITGYAIQAENIPASTAPYEIFAMIGGQ